MFNFADLAEILYGSQSDFEDEEEPVGHPLLLPATRTRFYESVQQQNFPFRSTLINYILKAPLSQTVYQKLIKTCKFFFIKKPLVLASKLYTRSDDDKWFISINDECIDVADISCNVWVIDEMEIACFSDTRRTKPPREPSFISSIIPRIYKSDIEQLVLMHHNIFFDDLIVIASNCTMMNFSKVTVTNKDGTIITLEKIVQSFPKLDDFFFLSPDDADKKMFTPKTAEEMIKTPHFSNFTSLVLYQIPEIFGIDKMYDYIKGNTETTIELEYVNQISDEFRNRLQEVVDEIIEAAENKHYKIPMIKFHGMNHDSYQKLSALFI